MTSTMIEDADRIGRYYEECHTSYRKWGSGVYAAFALHYGYWDATTARHEDALDAMNRLMADQLDDLAGSRVLEAGCGVGSSALWLAGKRGAKVLGVSLSQRQVNEAKDFAESLGLGGSAEFRQSDYLQTGLEDEAIDAVWALESMCYCMEKSEFAREAFRLLRPGGQVVVADGFNGSIPAGYYATAMRKLWLRGWRVPNLVMAEEFERSLRSVGFREIATIDVTHNVLPSAREIFRRGVMGVPMYVATLKSRIRMAHLLGCIMQYPALVAGSWRYCVVSARKPLS